MKSIDRTVGSFHINVYAQITDLYILLCLKKMKQKKELRKEEES